MRYSVVALIALSLVHLSRPRVLLSQVQPFTYRGFYPNMTKQELEQAASRGRVPVECVTLREAVPGGVQMMCSTPGVFDSFPLHTPHLQFMAGLDSTAHVPFIAITEPGPRGATGEWVKGLIRQWGQPTSRLIPFHAKELITWLREPYLAQVDTTAGGRAVSLGLADVMMSTHFANLLRPKRPLIARRDSTAMASPRPSVELLPDEAPKLISAPPMVYPESLRQAGITGRVIVECVLDTIGHAESASVKIVASANPAFDQPAIDFVLGAAFTPGRLHGRPVRVLVNIPVDFKVTRSQ